MSILNQPIARLERKYDMAQELEGIAIAVPSGEVNSFSDEDDLYDLAS